MKIYTLECILHEICIVSYSYGRWTVYLNKTVLKRMFHKWYLKFKFYDLESLASLFLFGPLHDDVPKKQTWKVKNYIHQCVVRVRTDRRHSNNLSAIGISTEDIYYTSKYSIKSRTDLALINESTVHTSSAHCLGVMRPRHCLFSARIPNSNLI